MSLMLSALDGRVVLKGFLGEGGMGQVHRAWDQVLERAVAVKFLHGDDSREAERLVLEARLQARVDHPHVVKVHEVGTLGGRPCILLQLVEGRNLAVLASKLPLAAKVELLRQAAEGLHAAHVQGLLHRDIKPGNVLVEETQDGRRALLSDFGLARDQEGGTTRSGFPAGTLDFMSPEQLLGQGPLEYRSDVYALGATLYFLLAGRQPFRGNLQATPADRDTPASGTGEENPAQLLRRILEEEPPALDRLIPGIPRELPLIIAKAMAKEPGQRYASAEAFAQDLGRFQRGEPILAHTPGILERIQKWSRRNRASARIVLVALGLAVLGLGYTAYASRRATRNALENARIGAAASAMESSLAREYLLPAHDLRPAMEALRRQMAALASDPSRAEAPRAYALGRGHQLLGEWTQARIQLERARTLGFRTPEGELAYGLVLAELYQQGIKQARAIPDKGLQQTRTEALRRDLLAPAVAAIQAQASATPERAALLLGQVDLLQGRLDEALARARAAQASPPEQAEGLFLESRVLEEKRQLLYVKHAHVEALTVLSDMVQVLERAHAIARSNPQVMEAQVQATLTQASHLRSLGSPTAEVLSQAQAALEAFKALHGDEGRLAIVEATLLQRQSMAKKDVGQSGVQEDAAALALLREAAARKPGDADLQRVLVNAYYSFCYGKVAAGEDPGGAFEEGYRAVDATQKLIPLEWRIPYTGALLAYPHSLYLNNHGCDARAAAQRGILYAEQAIALGGGPSARGSRSDCRIELAKAQFAAGEDPRGAIAQLVEDDAQSLAAAPSDQILRINAASGVIQAAQLERCLQGEAAPLLEKAALWSRDNNPKYLQAQRNLLDIQLLRPMAELSAVKACLAQILGVEKAFHTRLALEGGTAQLLLARAQAKAGADPAAAFGEARKCFLIMEKEEPGNVQAYAESAFACIEEAAWRVSRGRPAEPSLAAARAALVRCRGVQDGQALVFALEAAVLALEAEAAPREPKARLQGQAHSLWAEALKRNANLARHPRFAGIPGLGG